MEVKYNVKGEQRKALVTAIGEILECKPKYLGMPSAAYEINGFTVDKEGTLHFSDQADTELVEQLLEKIELAGFVFEENTSEETVDLTVSMPRSSFKYLAIENLEKLIEGKGALIKKALGIDSLPIEVDEEKVSFPWFHVMPKDCEEVNAYTHFIYALCEMAYNQKRISVKEKAVKNEKYAFRCILLRLGFIGDQYKTERKILLKNLTGSTAFKGGVKDEISE